MEFSGIHIETAVVFYNFEDQWLCLHKAIHI